MLRVRVGLHLGWAGPGKVGFAPTNSKPPQGSHFAEPIPYHGAPLHSKTGGCDPLPAPAWKRAPWLYTTTRISLYPPWGPNPARFPTRQSGPCLQPGKSRALTGYAEASRQIAQVRLGSNRQPGNPQQPPATWQPGASRQPGSLACFTGCQVARLEFFPRLEKVARLPGWNAG